MLPSAAIAARLAGSASAHLGGTGNPGAYNMATQLGRRWGVGVGMADAAKGVAAALLGKHLAGDTGCYAAATAAVAGHTYPLGRRGGRGVATSFGSCIVVFPAWVPLDLAIGAATLVGRRGAPAGTRAGHAALVSTAAFFAAATVVAWRGWPNPAGPRTGPGLFGYAAATSVLTASKWLRP
ncbi:MAG: hypothetical protein NVSMB17_03160 [Candidatus Dormibacteria bacterium]